MENQSGANQFFILSVITGDRVGIVDEVAKFLFDRQCSIEDSRMAVLGGEFAMVLLAYGAIEAVSQLESDLHLLEEASGLKSVFRKTQSPKQPRPQNTLPYRIRATALDHPGIVFKISHQLRQKGINIQNANTETISAPFGGSPIFHLDMQVDIPATLPLAQLKKQLSELAEQENMDIEIHSTPR